MTGIITIHDLVEQLVGDLGDDSSTAKKAPLIEAVDPETWKIHGDALLEDVSKALGVSLPSEGYNTFNGLVLGTLGTIPPDGSTVEVEIAGLRIKVTEIRNHQVQTAAICLEIPVSAEDSR